MAGKPWYNNGIIEIQCNVNKEQLPEGFVRGRLPTKQSTKDKLSNYRKSLNESTKQEINAKRSVTMKSHYNEMSNEQRIEKRKLISDGLNARSKQDIESWKDNISKGVTGKNIGHMPWNFGLTKDTDDRLKQISEKLSIIVKQHMDTLPPEYFKEWRARMRETARKNNSYRSSRAEEQLYAQLVEQYGKDDVVQQYYDEERYPFSCDFYIPSEDLFIELNRHPAHGPHPFNKDNPDDIKLLESLKNDTKNPKWSSMIVDVWSVRDVNKLQTAIKNNLNYLTIY